MSDYVLQCLAMSCNGCVCVCVQDGMTALMHAVKGGHNEVAELLMSKGADPLVVGTVSEHTAPYYTVLHCTAMHCTALTALYCNALYCTVP